MATAVDTLRKDAELVVDVCMSVEQDDVVTIICDDEHREQAELARGGQARIVTHGDGRPNSTTGVSAKLSAVRMSNNSLEIAVTPLCSMSMLRQFS